MKFLLVVAAVIAVVVAGPTQRGLVTPILAGAAPVVVPEVVVDPAIIAPVNPVLVVEEASSVDISPALIDFPLSEAGEVIATPVVDVPAAISSAPLVQIILNINQAAAESSPATPAPVVVPEPADVAEPVQVVESAPVSPVQVVDAVPISPVQVVDTVPVSPVQVVDVAPIVVEPVIIGTPVIPSPAVVLPDELN